MTTNHSALLVLVKAPDMKSRRFTSSMFIILSGYRFIEKREIDWRRTSFFGLFGCFYLGGFQYLVYVKIFSRVFPRADSFVKLTMAQKLKDHAGMLQVVGQIAADLLIHIPFFYFPTFLLLKDLMLNPEGIRIKGE